MKKFISILLAACTLLVPSTSFAQAIDENVLKEHVEIRDQNIYVPTRNGVQRATYEEAIKIDKFNKMGLEELTGSYILGDYKSGEILEGYNIDEVRAMASTSKLVAVFVVLDKIKDGTISRDDIVKIDHECSSLTGSTYKLKENEEITVDDLLKASLVVSGNDAITALGKHVAGTKEGFVNMMNKKCKELGLTNAHMVNPTGLTDYSIEDYNKMTTREMFILTRELIRTHPNILQLTSIQELNKTDREYHEYNTNPLLGVVEGIDGLKTGYTNAAGRCLIATGLKNGAEDGSTKDIRLIGVTTGSKGDWQRYSASRRLMEDGFKNYSYIPVNNLEDIVTKVNIEGCSEEETNVYPKEIGTALWDNKTEISTKVNIRKNLKAPLPAGEIVGEVSYYMGDKEVFKTDLVLTNSASEKGFLFKIQNICENIFYNIRNAA